MHFDSGLAYRIPSLATNVAIARQSFSEQLPQVLGESRARLIDNAADRHLRRYVDDLGAGERIVGFFWQPEKDGSHSLWYGIAGDLHGPGTFNPVDLALAPRSPISEHAAQIAYYASLFGVPVPATQRPMR